MKWALTLPPLTLLLWAPFSIAQVTVAVIDTGIDFKHPDLKNHLWTNNGEVGFDATGKDRRFNGVDDDGNGYIDDVHGFNFAQGTPDISDRQGHGTHVSGIITAGCGEAQIMALKYYDPQASGFENARATVEALRYAVKMGAQIINFSGGGPGQNFQEESILKRAAQQGILVLAAAGNEASNNDQVGYFPASYRLPNIISVGSIDEKKNLVASSNWGQNSVDLLAPGDQILSTLPGQRHGRMSGTSQATAQVTGAAAWIWAHRPTARTLEDLKRQLLASGDRLTPYQNVTKHGVAVNLSRLIQMKDQDENAFGEFIQNDNDMEEAQYLSSFTLRTNVKLETQVP